MFYMIFDKLLVILRWMYKVSTGRKVVRTCNEHNAIYIWLLPRTYMYIELDLINAFTSSLE